MVSISISLDLSIILAVAVSMVRSSGFTAFFSFFFATTTFCLTSSVDITRFLLSSFYPLLALPSRSWLYQAALGFTKPLLALPSPFAF
jgi:hypothetical protein